MGLAGALQYAYWVYLALQLLSYPHKYTLSNRPFLVKIQNGFNFSGSCGPYVEIPWVPNFQGQDTEQTYIYTTRTTIINQFSSMCHNVSMCTQCHIITAQEEMERSFHIFNGPQCANMEFFWQFWVAHESSDCIHLAFPLYSPLYQYTYQIYKQSNKELELCAFGLT